jgi:hypothetical protein
VPEEGLEPPDTRIMIPAHFGVGIGNAALVGHAVGHTRKSGCIQARGFVPIVSRARKNASQPDAWSELEGAETAR